MQVLKAPVTSSQPPAASDPECVIPKRSEGSAVRLVSAAAFRDVHHENFCVRDILFSTT